MNSSTSPVDLSLPLNAPAATPASVLPQGLWAVAGAGLALVVGFAALAQLRGPVGTAASGSPPSSAAAPAVTALSAQPVAGAASAVHQPCGNCGVVEAVDAVKLRGKANGTGAVIGGVLGGVIGHEIGGNTTGTVIGAVGGGVAGHQIEKHVRSKTAYRVKVRMDDGSLRTFTESAPRAVGSHVVVDQQRLRTVAASAALP